MNNKKNGWPKESRRHGLASKGIPTKEQNQIVIDDKSGVWFVSHGIVEDIIAVSLKKLVNFDSLLKTNEAKGISRESYESISPKIIIIPSKDVDVSIEWLEFEYEDGNNSRKAELKRMVRITIKQIEKRLPIERDIDTRMELHLSRKKYIEFLNGKER